MPLNFPEAWQTRVRNQLTSANLAPWLEGIEEIDTNVLETGSGSASEQNIVHIPTSVFMPDVLINNTTYPIALQAYTDSEMIVQLDKYQSKVVTVSDDQIVGASYARIDNATNRLVISITSKKYMKAIHSLAPNANSANTPVVKTTGGAVGTRKRMTFVDIVGLKDAFDKQDCPQEGRRLVLCTDHWNDLLIDESNKYFNKLLVDYKSGQPAPVIAGFEIYQYIAMPYFTTAGAKVPFAAVPAATDNKASVAFYVPNAVKKTGLTKQYFARHTWTLKTKQTGSHTATTSSW